MTFKGALKRCCGRTLTFIKGELKPDNNANMDIEVACPFPGCDHVYRHDDAAIVVELLTIHGMTHSAAATPGGNINETRWGESRDGTRLRGDDIVVQYFWCAVTTI